MTTYKEAGVDIENTDALVEDISELSNLWEMDKIFNPNEDFDSKSIIDLWDKRIGKILSD